MKSPRILAVYGHPDDEGQVTGTLAHFIANGAVVTLVCATRGEVGEISDSALATQETLWYTRELELRASMAQIGLADVRFLPFRDSGMVGTPENEDSRSLHQQPAAVVVEALIRIIREVRPGMVFTWDPTGGYGHPDHIAVHKHTVEAFDTSGNAEAYPEAGPPWAPERLYWGSRGMKQFASIFLEMERRGTLSEAMEPERKARFEKAMLDPDPPVSVVHDVSAYIPLKRLAASMHRSQFGENSMFARIPEDMRARFYGQERFFQARPEWAPGTEPAPGFDS